MKDSLERFRAVCEDTLARRCVRNLGATDSCARGELCGHAVPRKRKDRSNLRDDSCRPVDPVGTYSGFGREVRHSSDTQSIHSKWTLASSGCVEGSTPGTPVSSVPVAAAKDLVKPPSSHGQ